MHGCHRKHPARRVSVATAIRLVLLAACAAGIAVSGYLTTVHYADAPLFCSTQGTVDCEAVLHSRYATLAGIPISVGGIVWFAGMAAIAILRPVSRVALAWLAVGLLSVLWLVYVELFRLEKLCLWCSAAHLLIVVCIGTVLLAASRSEPAA